MLVDRTPCKCDEIVLLAVEAETETCRGSCQAELQKRDFYARGDASVTLMCMNLRIQR